MDIDEFNKLVSDGSSIVDFWAPWCAPCRMITPVLERLAEEENVPLIKINVDEEPVIAAALGITGIPTVVFYKDGVAINQFTGAKPGSAIKQELFGE